MGRYKSVEIKGLFIEDFNEIFENSFIEAIKGLKLSKNEITEKLAPKFDEMIAGYEDTISNFYLENHKFNLNTFLKTHFKNQKIIAKTNKNSFVNLLITSQILLEGVNKSVIMLVLDSDKSICSSSNCFNIFDILY